MSLEIVSGRAGYVSLSSVTTAMPSPVGDTPVVMSGQVVQFRIGNSVVMFRSPMFVSITEGDEVAAIGTLKNGVLVAVGIRNLTTGADYCPPTGILTAGAWSMIILGIPLLGLMGTGIIFIFTGGLMLMKAMSRNSAYKQLKKASSRK